VILLNVPEAVQPADVVAVGLTGADLNLGSTTAELLPVSTVEAVRQYIAGEGLASSSGSVHPLPLPGEVPSSVLLVGLGDGSPRDLRVAAVALGRAITKRPDGQRVAVAIDAATPELSQALAEGLVLGGYEFTEASKSVENLIQVELIGEVSTDGLTAGDEAGNAACWARDLGNTPANLLFPERFGEIATAQLVAGGCTVEVRDEQWLAANGFGGILAVGGGSATAPRLIEARYRPARNTSGKHVVLVGKGITFDTGGINLKSIDNIRMMHTDMCGGAAVLGAVQYAAMRELPVRVTALVPAAENAVSGSSMRPSDVITHYGGRTTEVGNTDAEGRLVLADALAYAVARLKPDVLIDVATLTGAMKVALGMNIAGYFANDDSVAADLEAAAVASDEPIWRMPLEHSYSSLLDSSVADAANDPGNPGGITAALFLQPFVADAAWAHLDIAGPARAPENGPIASKGATGYGTRLLAAYLDNLA